MEHDEPEILPSLGVLQAFVAAVRRGSVTAAAADRHLTHSAVSRHLRALEAHLGRELFERRNRGIHPTPAARRLADDVATALADLHAALRRTRGTPRHEAIVVSCEPTLLMRWLIPRLPGLQEHAPGLTCRFVAAGGPVAFARDGIDLAVRRNDFPLTPGVHVAELMPERIGPVCHPRLTDRLQGDPAAWDVTLLHTATRPGAWADWARAAGQPLPGGPHQHLEHFYLTLQAAAAGVGAAVASHTMVRDDIAGGTLAAPHGFVADGSRYLLLSDRPLDDDPSRRAVARWLQDQGAEHV
jgi:LysR family transcriptional regulator, glycine cleavage system transcriptional activator